MSLFKTDKENPPQSAGFSGGWRRHIATAVKSVVVCTAVLIGGGAALSTPAAAQSWADTRAHDKGCSNKTRVWHVRCEHANGGKQLIVEHEGGELAIPGHRVIDDHDLVEVESQADTINAELPPLKEFVLPGGHPDAAWCHHCRTVARRLERHVIALHETDEEAINPVSQALINRLSDLLFVMARLINLRHEAPETLWMPKADR